MKKNIKILIGILLVVAVIIILFIKSNNYKEYSRDYFYMDTYINVKIYSNSASKANIALDKVDSIYSLYHNLTDKYNEHDNGLYVLNQKGSATIDYRLYKMIEYGASWYSKTNGLLNIGIGDLTDVWKKYRDAGTGVPSLDELKDADINFNDILINETISDIEDAKVSNSVILSNGVTIDLGAISKGYTTELVGDYLKSVGLNKFIINAGGNVLVGDYYKNSGTYKIGIEDPTDTSKVYKVVKGNNIAVVTSGGYQRNYTYNGVTYNHIIDPTTLYPANNMQSVTIIDKSSKEADALSTTLFLMTVDEGKEFIKNYDAQAIWYLNDGTVATTDGFSNYE